MSSATKRPYHHADLRAALLREVLTALEAGERTDALSMREIARRVGVSHTAAYAHFADKAALWSAVADIGFERLRRALRSAVDAQASPALALGAAGLAYLAFARAEPALFGLMFACGPPEPAVGAQPGGSAFDVLVAAVAALPRAGQPRPAQQVRADALTAWSLVHGLACLEDANALGASDFEARADLEVHAVKTLVRGFEAAP